VDTPADDSEGSKKEVNMASSSEDDVMDNTDDLEGDLFGGSDDEAPIEKARELSDHELDSGDDEDRNDRAPNKGDDREVDFESGREANIQDYTVYRHPLPKPADGEVR
jgi:RNA polymerase-associated protein LEO1